LRLSKLRTCRSWCWCPEWEMTSSVQGGCEIGDIFVLNKADHPQVERAERELQAALSLAIPTVGLR
jgi:hypothetical protein